MKKPVKKVVRRRYDDGGIVERTFGEDEPVKSRFGDDMLEKARAYTALAREPMPGGGSEKSASRAASKPAAPKVTTTTSTPKIEAPAKAKAGEADDGSRSTAEISRLARSGSPTKASTSASSDDDEKSSYRKGTLEDPEFRKKLEKEQGLEGVYPEALLPAAKIAKTAISGARAAGAAGTALAKSGSRGVGPARGEPNLRMYRQPELPAPAAKPALPAPKNGGALEGPTPQKLLPGPKAGEREADAAMKAANERARGIRADMAKKAEKAATFKKRMTDAAERKAAAARRAPEKPAPRDADDARMGGEGGGYRKGGSVRGCGIARKGFTRGTMR